MNQSLTYKKLRDYILIVFVYLFFRMNSYFTRGRLSSNSYLLEGLLLLHFRFC